MFTRFLTGTLVAGTASLWLATASAHSIKAEPAEAVQAAFDIIETTIVTKGDTAVFTTRVRGEAGKDKPDATGKFEGSSVYAYVWPTSLDSGEIGFDKAQGIVALAVTFHPDFDDAARGGKNRHVWHPHWVVLAEDKACGGGLKVIDIPEGAKPKVPETWPGVPLLNESMSSGWLRPRMRWPSQSTDTSRGRRIGRGVLGSGRLTGRAATKKPERGRAVIRRASSSQW